MVKSAYSIVEIVFGQNVYLYDTNGSPIGMQYHAANTAKSVWETLTGMTLGFL